MGNFIGNLFDSLGVQTPFNSDYIDRKNTTDLLDALRSFTDSTNAANLAPLQTARDNALAPYSRQQAINAGTQAAIDTQNSLSDPNYLRSLGMTDDEINYALANQPKTSPINNVTTDNKPISLADALSIGNKAQARDNVNLIPPEARLAAGQQMYGNNIYNNPALSTMNPTTLKMILPMLMKQDENTKSTIQKQANLDAAGQLLGTINKDTDPFTAMTTAAKAAELGLPVNGYVLTDLLKPKPPAHIPAGSMVQQPDGSWKQVGQAKTGAHVQLANGNIGLINTDGTISDTGVGFYQRPVGGRGGGGGGGTGGGGFDFSKKDANRFHNYEVSGQADSDMSLYAEYTDRVKNGDDIKPADQARYNAAAKRLKPYLEYTGQVPRGQENNTPQVTSQPTEQVDNSAPAQFIRQAKAENWTKEQVLDGLHGKGIYDYDSYVW